MDFSKTHDIKGLEEKLEFIFNYFKKKYHWLCMLEIS